MYKDEGSVNFSCKSLILDFNYWKAVSNKACNINVVWNIFIKFSIALLIGWQGMADKLDASCCAISSKESSLLSQSVY